MSSVLFRDRYDHKRNDHERTVLEVNVKYESNDPHWKELADYLRKLNVDFYWRIQDRISEESACKAMPPSRPVHGSGLGISMNIRQEHFPFVTTEEKEPDNPKGHVNKGEKRDTLRGDDI